MTVVLHSRMGNTLTICGARRIEQDHINWYVWYGKNLAPDIISKAAGNLTILEVDE